MGADHGRILARAGERRSPANHARAGTQGPGRTFEQCVLGEALLRVRQPLREEEVAHEARACRESAVPPSQLSLYSEAGGAGGAEEEAEAEEDEAGVVDAEYLHCMHSALTDTIHPPFTYYIITYL